MLLKMNGNIIALVFGKVLQLSITFFNIKILTEFLSVKDISTYYLVTGIAVLLANVFIVPIGQYFNRKLFYYEQNLTEAIGSLLLLRCVLSIIAVFIAVPVFYITNIYEVMSLTSYTVIIIVSILSSNFSTLANSINTFGRRIEFTFFLTAISASSLILSVTLTSYIEKSVYYWLVGMYLGQFIFVPILLTRLIPIGKISYNKIIRFINGESKVELFDFIIPLSKIAILSWLGAFAYRYIINYKFDVELVAVVAIGLSLCSNIYSSLESVLFQYYKPIFLQKINKKNKQEREAEFNNVASVLFAFYLTISIFFALNVDYIIQMVFGDKLVGIKYVILSGVIIEFFKSLRNIISLGALSEFNNNIMVRPYLINILVLVFILFSKTEQPLTLVCLSLILGSLVSFLLSYINIKKILDIRLDKTKFFQCSLILSIVVVCHIMLIEYFQGLILFFTSSIIGVITLLMFYKKGLINYG